MALKQKIFLILILSIIIQCYAKLPNFSSLKSPSVNSISSSSFSSPLQVPLSHQRTIFIGGEPLPEDDDTAALQAALKNLSTTGGILQLDSRRYTVSGPLNVPDNVILQGQGFSTIIYQPHNYTATLINLGHGSGLRYIQLQQEQPDPNIANWAPYSDYDYQVRVQHDQATVEQIMILNPYLGIAIEPPTQDGSIGQIQLFNIRGQPLKVGIRIDHALDVIHIQQVHFWPFWAWNSNIDGWMHGSGGATAIVSVRNDNPIFGQMFFFGYTTGILFSQPSCSGTSCGITSKPKISEYDCDYCDYGIDVEGDGVRGISVSQFSYQAPGDGNGIGFVSSGSSVTGTISQADLTLAGANAIRVEGNNSFLIVSGSIIRTWNLSGKGFPCFEAVAGTNSQILVDTTYYGDGKGAAAIGAGVLAGPTVKQAAVS